ncbi:MAG: universal stress protein [Alphaproteobacteria bacterium]
MLGPSDKILVATDFSADGAKALACACDLAQRFGVETLVLHVCRREGPGAAGGPDSPLPRPLEACLATLRDRGLLARGLVRRGDPAAEILDVAARENASLIVLGAHGEASTRGVLLGSVADRVMRRATRPLLVVRRDRSADGAEQPGRGGGGEAEDSESQAGA